MADEPTVSTVEAGHLEQLRKFIWPSNLSENDILRWHNQGFEFSDLDMCRFGLLQKSGGPCGVLAAIQALLWKDLAFEQVKAPRQAEDVALGFDYSAKLATDESKTEDAPAPAADAAAATAAAAGTAPAVTATAVTAAAEPATGDAPVVVAAPVAEAVPVAAAGATPAATAPATAPAAATAEATPDPTPPAVAAAEPAAVPEAAPREFSPFNPTHAQRSEALVRALSFVLWQALNIYQERRTVTVVTSKQMPVTITTPASELCLHVVASPFQLRALVRQLLPQWRSSSGVVLFMYSLLLTRSLEQVRKDMDDAGATLTATFGHCTQELMNLVLSGHAASQVHDGIIPMDDTGLMLRGIDKQPTVGYLSHLEVLRYTKVGSLYKQPKFPVWVVGSESHYTVLFGDDKDINKVSKLEELRDKAKIAFQTYDASQSGMIETEKMVDVLVCVDVPLSTQAELNTLTSGMDPSRTGIILWNDFWTTLSKFVRDRESGGAAGAAPAPATAAPRPTKRPRTDSDVARAIQADLDAGGDGNVWAKWEEEDKKLAESAPAAAPPVVRSDSQMARDLAAQWGAPGAAPAASPAAAPAPAPVDPSAGPATFYLWHFNGLKRRVRGVEQPPSLHRARVTKAPDDMIVTTSTSSKKLNDVIRTKFPGAIIEWDSICPSIDG